MSASASNSTRIRSSNDKYLRNEFNQIFGDNASIASQQPEGMQINNMIKQAVLIFTSATTDQLRGVNGEIQYKTKEVLERIAMSFIQKRPKSVLLRETTETRIISPFIYYFIRCGIGYQSFLSN